MQGLAQRLTLIAKGHRTAAVAAAVLIPKDIVDPMQCAEMTI